MPGLKLIFSRGARVSALKILLSLMLLVLSVVVSASRRFESERVQAADARKVLMNPPDKFWSRKAPRLFQVRFKTTKGEFLVELRRDLAPHGVDRFYNLVRAGFFDGSRFFRVR